jgi:uncharacterized YigZ family protein
MPNTIKEITTATIKIHRSEFVAFLYPVVNAINVKALLARHNEMYKDATHNCYAYILGKKQETQYYSDQGEPSGTAGKPILNALLKHELTNVLGIVTRYFGGVKLGVRGLIDAYTEVMEKAVAKALPVEYVVWERVFINCNYHQLDLLKKALKPLKAEVVHVNFTDLVEAEIVFPDSQNSEVNKLLDELSQNGHIIILHPD